MGHASLPNSAGPKGPHRGTPRFHLLHEHGSWVLFVHEDGVTDIHSKVVAQHASCSVLHTTCFGPDIDVGLKIRKIDDLVRDITHPSIPVLVLVLAAQARDMSHAGEHGHTEEQVLRLFRGYTRLVKWLLYHPNLTVSANTFNRIAH